MQLIFETMPGLEFVAAEEIDDLAGFLPTAIAPGRLVGRAPAGRPMIEALADGLRCVERFGALIAEARVCDLADVEAATVAAPLQRHLRLDQTFAVRGARRGAHEFNQQGLASAVGAGVCSVFEQRHEGARPAVDLDGPDVILRADLFDDQLLLWADAIGDRGLGERRYRHYKHMASMRPTVAQLLLRLAGWALPGPFEDAVLVDTFCGSATVLIEGGLLLPPTRGRLHGVERFSTHVQGAIENIARAGLEFSIHVHQGMAERADEAIAHLPRDRPRLVVTNPPFGRRVARPGQVETLYREAAAAWHRLGAQRVVTLTERKRAMTAAIEAAGFEIEEALPARYGVIPVTVFVADRGSES